MKGWIIAVIVVGAIVSLIATAIIISCIVKKVRKNRQEKEETDE